jgi:hypothetical protein
LVVRICLYAPWRGIDELAYHLDATGASTGSNAPDRFDSIQIGHEVGVESAEQYASLCTRELRVADPFALLSYAGTVVGDVSNPVPLYKLAEFCRAVGRLDLWRRGVAIALECEHETYEQTYYRAMAKGLLGDLSAWADFEARAFNPSWGCSRSKLNWTTALWDGAEDLDDKTFLIRRQGGYGDEIMMFRFVRPLARRTKQLILDVKPELLELAQHNFGAVATVVSMESDVPPCDVDRFVWSMSLPHVCDGLPPFEALSAAIPASLTLRESRRTRVGICWACGATARDHAERSLPSDMLAPLFSLDDVEWHCLQVGVRASDAEGHPALVQPDPPLRSFLDTANLIMALDCVVTVDTAVYHLAGSLGVPTLLLLRFASDWKWGLTDTTPWYPSARIYRQRSPGEWGPVIADVVTQIEMMSTQRTVNQVMMPAG